MNNVMDYIINNANFNAIVNGELVGDSEELRNTIYNSERFQMRSKMNNISVYSMRNAGRYEFLIFFQSVMVDKIFVFTDDELYNVVTLSTHNKLKASSANVFVKGYISYYNDATTIDEIIERKIKSRFWILKNQCKLERDGNFFDICGTIDDKDSIMFMKRDLRYYFGIYTDDDNDIKSISIDLHFSNGIYTSGEVKVCGDMNENHRIACEYYIKKYCEIRAKNIFM